MISKKFVRLFACVLSLLVLLTCCVGCASDDKQNALDEHDYFFDPDTPKDENAITVAFHSISNTALFIREYMDKTGKTVNVVEYTYPDTYEQFNTKIMAKDSDIDVYVAIPLYEYAYISSGYYIDLSQFDVLNERFESNDFARCAASYNETYVGIPINSYSYDSSTNTQADTLTKYLIKNVHALDGKFDDPNGEELAAVLKHFRDDPSDSRENAIYEDEITMIGSYYLMMSPGCEKQDEAADFLAFVFDHIAGHIEVEHSLSTYPELDSYEDIHLDVDYQSWAIIEPIRTAYNQIIDSETPLSDSEIEALAYDAARQTLMRLQG